MEMPIAQGGSMKDLEQQREYRKEKTMRRRLFGGGLLTAALAGLILIIPTGSDYTVSQRDSAPDGITEELVITEIAESTDEAPFLTSLEEEPTGEVALGFSSSGNPEYVTAQPPLIEIPGPILVADNWTPSSPVSTGDTDAQPMIQPQGPRAPTIAGVPGGDSGPRGSGAPWPGGGSPGGGGNSGPRSPSSPISSGPAAPPSDPMPGDNGPMVAGPTTSPPANNQPGPVDLPDELSGPVVGSNDDPQNDWFSPGNSPGTAEITGDFTLNAGETLLFEILGTEAGIDYDQLIVSGDVALLDGSNIVIAFIDNFPLEETALAALYEFELILAETIALEAGVNFYYGFFDPADNALWNLHAPQDLSYYSEWSADSGITKEVSAQEDQSGQRLLVTYAPGKEASEPVSGPDEAFTPAVNIPTPGPLLLLATGLLLAGSFRRRA
jgi:hypothetical protein